MLHTTIPRTLVIEGKTKQNITQFQNPIKKMMEIGKIATPDTQFKHITTHCHGSVRSLQ